MNVHDRTKTSTWHRFLADEDASLSVELVLILPLLLWGFLTVITVFDVFRARTVALKANYAISDLLSRENTEIDGAYLTGAMNVFKYLTQGNSNTWVRVTQVVCSADCISDDERVLDMDWSESTDGVSGLEEEEMRTSLAKFIPLLPAGQYAIVVETSVDYSPPFLPPLDFIYYNDKGERKKVSWGYMKHNTFVDTVVTEPRFGPKLCWQGQSDCG
ncbi:hypothetical protein [Maritimibacter dapengensis]|uniref:Flp pilus assembly protein TadG n=1 Tax=Maritimibacter dapengensis TaxID=2836868 RepID=A0ABS6SZB4_9RHOB|nr:hypothetical protein [Maritimibacter dapengensis]MBV7378328.1 hypothetical protein [Maritimibacter dapengensis]